MANELTFVVIDRIKTALNDENKAARIHDMIPITCLSVSIYLMIFKSI